jgi:hypothetical protein
MLSERQFCSKPYLMSNAKNINFHQLWRVTLRQSRNKRRGGTLNMVTQYHHCVVCSSATVLPQVPPYSPTSLTTTYLRRQQSPGYLLHYLTLRNSRIPYRVHKTSLPVHTWPTWIRNILFHPSSLGTILRVVRCLQVCTWSQVFHARPRAPVPIYHNYAHPCSFILLA